MKYVAATLLALSLLGTGCKYNHLDDTTRTRATVMFNVALNEEIDQITTELSESTSRLQGITHRVKNAGVPYHKNYQPNRTYTLE